MIADIMDSRRFQALIKVKNIAVDRSADIDYNDYENLQRMHKTAF